MAILPVSSVNLDSNNRVGFRGDMEVAPLKRVDSDMEGKARTSVGKYATVPVVVLMTLNPSLSAQAAGNNAPEPKQITMEMPYAPSEASEAEPMYDFASEAAALSAPESAPQTSSTEAPYGWAWLKTEEIKFSHRGKTPISGFDMLYTTVEGDIEDPKEIQFVYIILDKENKAPNNPNACPPLVRELIYHKLADGREFCGVKIEENTVDKQGKTTGYMESEIKIDDDTANLLMDLLLNQSGWNNKTGIKYSATTSPRLIPPKFY